MLTESRQAFFKADSTNVLVFIGRFQPFHNGHKAVVDTALRLADKVALVIGSHDAPRNSRNPFTTAERIAMISAVYPQEVADGRIEFVPQVDHTYNLDRWIAGVTTGVEAVANRGGWTDKPRTIGLIGHSKDHSSFYLKSFPQWGNLEVDNVNGIDATTIRKAFFSRVPGVWSLTSTGVPRAVRAWLDDWKTGCDGEARAEAVMNTYDAIANEMDFVASYKRPYTRMSTTEVISFLAKNYGDQMAAAAEANPDLIEVILRDLRPQYAPIFHTTDAIVVQSGHILLVKRGAQPGKGLWALPGGFLDANEPLVDGVIRELREETKIAIPDPVLRGSIVAQRAFDDPHRSLRGRTITTAFYLRLADREDLPKIKGSDDAEKARWVPLAEVRRSFMYEDHYDMIEAMVGI